MQTICARRLRLALPCDAAAPRRARAALRQTGQIDAVRAEAMLVASELVTNAVLHSGCDRRDTVELTAEVSDDSLLIAVADPGRSLRRPQRVPHTGKPGGWGLHVVDELSRRWGVERGDGVRVWAELALPQRRPRQGGDCNAGR